MKTVFKRLVIVLFILCISGSVFAAETEKVTLKSNMTVVYKKLPEEAETFAEAFTNGIFYGRLRANIFYFEWDQENYLTGGIKKNNRAMGIGGSMIYKSAPFKGISTTFGLYTSQNPSFFRETKADVAYVRSGKDMFSRNQVKNGGSYNGDFGMTVLGQAFLQYDISGSFFILGRQMFESVFTASNDTKMIPNTFDGFSADIGVFSDSRIQFGYFTAQKLRDHVNSHDVIAFDSWNENDDSVVNRSLTRDLVGTDNELVIVSANTKRIKGLDATVSLLSVPDVITNTAFEANYRFSVGKWSVTPGMRFMFQGDKLDAHVPVANLLGNTNGYSDPDNLDGKIYAIRMDLGTGPLFFRLGYSKVADDADIIAPWRGFPTGGFTRAMGQYNWQANTESYMLRADYDFGVAGLIPGLHVLVRYAIQDFDDLKTGVPPDGNALNIDILKKLGKNLEMKFRFGLLDGDKNTYDMNGDLKTDVSYSEYRLEFNYLF